MEENQVTSSASSSSPQPENREDTIVAMEESNPSASQEVMSERTSENPSLGSVNAVQTGREITLLYPPRSNKVYTCQFCSKGFSTTQALGGHQNAHKLDREWEKKRKEMEENFPGLSFYNRHIINKPHLILGGYSEDALSNDNHLGITLEPFRRRGRGWVYPSFSGGRGGPMNMTVVPRVNPTRFFPGNYTFNHGSSSARGLGPRPAYNPMVPRNVPPFRPHGRTNLPSGLYPRENRLSGEDLTLRIGNDQVVVIDDDDDDQADEDNPNNWGNDLSL